MLPKVLRDLKPARGECRLHYHMIMHLLFHRGLAQRVHFLEHCPLIDGLARSKVRIEHRAGEASAVKVGWLRAPFDVSV